MKEAPKYSLTNSILRRKACMASVDVLLVNPFARCCPARVWKDSLPTIVAHISKIGNAYSQRLGTPVHSFPKAGITVNFSKRGGKSCNCPCRAINCEVWVPMSRVCNFSTELMIA